MSPLVSVDAYKERLPGYTPGQAQAYHRESARLADQAFLKLLINHRYTKVILLCGGAASGKTEFASLYLHDPHTIVYDGTLSSSTGADIKIRNCLRKRKDVSVYGIISNSLELVYAVFLQRDRKLSREIFVRTHVGARRVLYHVASHYPQLCLTIYESSLVKGKVIYTQLRFTHQQKMMSYLESIQISEQQIESLLLPIPH